MKHQFITIEGNIGAGKTTLSNILAQKLNAKLILEEFADNPFLPKFYEKPDQYAFPLELFLLMGENYVNDSSLGKNIHKMRCNFEKNMINYDGGEKLLYYI